jgi:hypothetical protein
MPQDWRTKDERQQAARALHARTIIDAKDLRVMSLSVDDEPMFTWDREKMGEVFDTMSKRMSDVGDAAREAAGSMKGVARGFARGGYISPSRYPEELGYHGWIDDIASPPLRAGDEFSFRTGPVPITADSISASAITADKISIDFDPASYSITSSATLDSVTAAAIESMYDVRRTDVIRGVDT